jgi:hypothetical protein
VAALTQDIHPIRYGAPGNSTQPTTIGLSASTTVYRGSIATTRSGYLVPASAPQASDIVWGLIDSVDETCSQATGVIDGQPGITGTTTAGAVMVLVATGSFWLNNGTGADAFLATDIGAVAYVIDEQTVGKTSASSTRPIAGEIIKPSDPLNVLAGKVAVKLGQPAGSTGGPS